MGAAWTPRCPPAACRDGGLSAVRRLPPWAGGALEEGSEFLPGAQRGAGVGVGLLLVSQEPGRELGGGVSQGHGTESRVSMMPVC